MEYLVMIVSLNSLKSIYEDNASSNKVRTNLTVRINLQNMSKPST